MGHDLLPPSVVAVRDLGASLKRGGYRSAAGYFWIYRGHIERAGHNIDSALSRAFKDSARSRERGMGGPVKAMALPVERPKELPLHREPWTPGGPGCARNATVAGAWFLIREAELGSALATSRTLDASGPKPMVHWALPTSKEDIKALGIARSPGCSCSRMPDRLGPAPLLAEALLGGFDTEGHPRGALPLFPDANGKPCSKEAMAATMVQAGHLLKVPLQTTNGSERISEHSLRVTGAQGLAHLGLDM